MGLVEESEKSFNCAICKCKEKRKFFLFVALGFCFPPRGVVVFDKNNAVTEENGDESGSPLFASFIFNKFHVHRDFADKTTIRRIMEHVQRDRMSPPTVARHSVALRINTTLRCIILHMFVCLWNAIHNNRF